MKNDSCSNANRMKVFALAALSGMALTVHAVDFPSASGDIALAEDWGGTLPATVDSVRFEVNNGAYTASDDVQFAAMTVTAKNVAFNMGVDVGNELRNLKFKSFMAPSVDQKIVLNGGIWNFQNGFFALCDKNKNRQSSRQLVEIDGGAVVTNVGDFRIAYRDNHNMLRLVNGSKMYFNKCDWDYGEGKSNTVEVLSGSELVAASYIRDSYYTGGNGIYTHNRFLVSGEGSKIRLTGTVSTSGWDVFALGAIYAGGSLTVENGGMVDSARSFVMGKGTNAWETTATVRSGGTMELRDGALVGSAKLTFGHLLAVSNASSSVSVTGDFKVGSGECSHGNAVVVSDDGTLSVSKRLYVGSGNEACSNTIYVADGGNMSVTSEIKVGENANSHDNIVVVSGGTFNAGNAIRISDNTSAYNNGFRVVDGGSLLVENKVHLGGYSSSHNTGGHNSGIFVSNGTFQCSYLEFGGSPTCVSNRLTVVGRGSVFRTTGDQQLYLFGYGAWHEMFLADGVSWEYPTTMYMDTNAFSNRFVITRGASFGILNGGSLFSGSGTASGANRMEVSDGASVNIGGRVELTRRDNVISVSNATFTVGKELYVGRTITGVTDVDISGNRFEIYGTNPVVTVGAEFRLYRDSALQINLPESGYADNVAPVQASTFVLSDRATLDIKGAVAMRECRERTKTRIPLVSTRSGVSVPDGIIESVNSAFVSAGAADCRIYVSEDGKNLMLKVPFRKGSVFVVR